MFGLSKGPSQDDGVVFSSYPTLINIEKQQLQLHPKRLKKQHVTCYNTSYTNIQFLGPSLLPDFALRLETASYFPLRQDEWKKDRAIRRASSRSEHSCGDFAKNRRHDFLGYSML